MDGPYTVFSLSRHGLSRIGGIETPLFGYPRIVWEKLFHWNPDSCSDDSLWSIEGTHFPWLGPRRQEDRGTGVVKNRTMYERCNRSLADAPRNNTFPLSKVFASTNAMAKHGTYKWDQPIQGMLVSSTESCAKGHFVAPMSKHAWPRCFHALKMYSGNLKDKNAFLAEVHGRESHP